MARSHSRSPHGRAGGDGIPWVLEVLREPCLYGRALDTPRPSERVQGIHDGRVVGVPLAGGAFRQHLRQVNCYWTVWSQDMESQTHRTRL